MSGECNKCGEHCLECLCDKSKTVNGESAFRHAMMPYENALAGPIPSYVKQLFLPFDPQRRTSAIRLAHDAKVLENAQRLINMEDREAFFGSVVEIKDEVVLKCCGKSAFDCECYEKCKCGMHPATHPDGFNMIISEFGMFDTVLEQEIDATCNVCNDKFFFKSKNTFECECEDENRRN